METKVRGSETQSTTANAAKQPTSTKNQKTKTQESLFNIKRTNYKNGFSDNIEGDIYTVTYTKNGMSVTRQNGETKQINFNTFIKTNNSADQQRAINFLKQQNGGVLYDLASEVTNLQYRTIKSGGEQGLYTPECEKIAGNEKSIAHELCHAIDNYDNKYSSCKHLSDDKTYVETVYKEFKKMVADGKRFNFQTNHNIPAEVFAEIGGYIITNGEYDDNKAIIKKYFRKTTAKIKELIKKARNFDQETRCRQTIKRAFF